MKIKKITSLFMALSLLGSVVLPTSVVKAENTEAFDPNGSYKAAIGIQTCTQVWINRFAFFDSDLNKYYETENANSMIAGDPSGDGASYDCEIEDIDIAGNGTYEVAIKNADFAGETDISQLYVATNIPADAPITFSDVSFSVDGNEIVTFDEPELEDETKYLAGGMVLLCINHWRPELVKKLSDLGLSETAANGYTLLQGTTGEEVKIKFTVSGFDYDNPDAVVTEETVEETTGENVEVVTSAPSTDNKKTVKEEKDDSSKIVMPIAGGVIVILIIAGVIVFATKKKD